MPTHRENFCAKSFDRYLAHQLDGPLPCWTPVPAGQDPPDFFLSLGNETYAVEVTSTQVLRKPSIGETPVNEETYEATHRAMVNTLEDAACTRKLKGCYVISFDQPIASVDFHEAQNHFVVEVLDAISRSQEKPVSWSEPVRQDDKTLCCLLKVGEGDIHIFEEFSDGAWTDSPEFLAFVTEIFRHVIIRKKRLLEAKRISQPSILLLLNTYGLADSKTCTSCIEKIQERDSFCAIFIVQTDGSGYIVYSKQPTWPCGSSVGAA
jgi:hypothetical protein